MTAFDSSNREYDAHASTRVATEADLDGVSATLWAAFNDDPLWSWAFPERDELEVWWRFLINSALRYPWVWIRGGYVAASVWIPPGGSELTEQEEARVEPLLDDLLGGRSGEVLELLERFDASRPTDEPHYYLSLLGTHPDHRSQGLGMDLLTENLARIDKGAMPAYLESSNPSNDKRYERVGFRRVGEFSTPDGSRTGKASCAPRRTVRSSFEPCVLGHQQELHSGPRRAKAEARVEPLWAVLLVGPDPQPARLRPALDRRAGECRSKATVAMLGGDIDRSDLRAVAGPHQLGEANRRAVLNRREDGARAGQVDLPLGS
jgi:GNAT superfamily N-acetyltransferase